MSSKHKTFTALFVLAAIALVAFYVSGQAASVLTGAGLPGELVDAYCVTLAIFAAGLVCFLFGAHPLATMILGTISAFVVLTLHQDPLIRYLALAAVLFCIGAYGMVVSRNAVRVLICIELMLNAVNINMVSFSRYVDPLWIHGQLFAIFILTVAAAEAAVGLAIVLSIYRNQASVDMEKFNLLKW